jgi:hypothetical protein
VALSSLEVALIDRNISGQFTQAMILSFEQFPNILLMRSNNSKYSTLPSFAVVAHIDHIVSEINLSSSSILLLVLKLAVVELVLLVQNQEALVGGLAGTTKVRAILILFDQRKKDLDSA